MARAVMAAVRSEGWRTIEINVASCQDEHGFRSELHAALTPELASLTDKARSLLGDGIDALNRRTQSVKVSVAGVGALEVGVGGSDTEDWTHVANDVLRLIARVDHDQRWLIYVDELPIMLFNIIRVDPQNGVQRVRRFLDWFRNDVRALPDVRTLRWLVSGSVGLDTLVQQHGMADTINSMKHEGLEPFSEPVAIRMLSKLATHYAMTLSDDDARNMVAAVLWPQPYCLQLAFNHLRSLMTAAPGTLAGELIEQAIDKLVQPGGDNDFHYWEKRLTIQLSGADASYCLALLTLAAQTADGARAENLLVELQERMPNATTEEAIRAFVILRDILQRDAYWWPDESSGHKRYRFRLEPLQRWWLRRNTL